MFDFGGSQEKSRKTFSVFTTFVMCCLTTSLLISSFATQYWFESGCKFGGKESPSSGVHFGLFSGKNYYVSLTSIWCDVKIVCEDGDCMFSCARTADLRRDHLRLVKAHGTPSNFSNENCDFFTIVSAQMVMLKTLSPVHPAALGGPNLSDGVGVAGRDLFEEGLTTDSSMTTTEEGKMLKSDFAMVIKRACDLCPQSVIYFYLRQSSTWTLYRY
ncbi:uncharacterized protein [Palaemon carinicauda]|uniref:uncharacterized protein n=1 Tax=Palaemon carinicauda TaxID=392227 RepID=UPI0035B57216